MPVRRRLHERLPDVLDAALALFGANGYAATQMSQIAAEVGISEAALYRYVAGKSTLFDLVIRRTLLFDPLPTDGFPLPAVTLDETIIGIRSRIGAPTPIGVLAVALATDEVDDAEIELADVLAEFWSIQVLIGPAMNMIERSAREIPELKAFVDVELRRPMVAAFAELLRRRAAAGQLRTTHDPLTAARVLLEMVTYFTRHRHSDPDGAAIPDAVAQATVIDIAVNGLTRSP